jgi:hypothetical protein
MALKVVSIDAKRPTQVLIYAMGKEVTDHDQVMALMWTTFAELSFGGKWKYKLLMKDFEKFGMIHYCAKFTMVKPTTT